VTQPS